LIDDLAIDGNAALQIQPELEGLSFLNGRHHVDI
jgi:hypothetical protein